MLRAGDIVSAVMSVAWVTQPGRPAIDLIASLTNGKINAAIVTDEENHLVGVVTQTDFLSTLGRVPASGPSNIG